ncbi:MAG TPA: adenylate kinase [Thermoanaerobaculia bacterium]|nr:adenylate kinase [Thermoanaerobaculia bacterium]
MNKIVLIGPPGSGKGTQAKLLADRLDIPHISTGDILRDAVRKETELGRRAAPIMAEGGLVPDDLMIGIIGERLAEPDAGNGFILDGFPRTVLQAEKLDALMAGNGNGALRVVHLLVPDDLIVRRIAARRSCPSCGAVYHLEQSPPSVPGLCDRCGSALVARPDDTEEAVRARLGMFQQKTMPVVTFYRSKEQLHEVDGEGPVDQVFERVAKHLDG